MRKPKQGAVHSAAPPLDISQADLAAALAFDSASASEPEQRRHLSRLGHGQEGVVRLRGRVWRLQYRAAPDAKGRRRQPSVRIGTVEDMNREQARAAARRMLEQLAPRRVAPGSSCTWEAWVDRYVLVYLPLLRPTSQESVGSVIRVHLSPAFAGLHLHEIRPARVQTWIAKQRAHGVAPSTIAVRYAVLRRMLRRARRESLAVQVPSGSDIDLPRDDAVRGRGHSRAFTTEQVQSILTKASEPWRTLFMLLAFCGLRISEALGLRWCDLDLQAGIIRIVRQAVGGRETAPKTAASVAERRIPPVLLGHLRAFKAERVELVSIDAFLFPSPRDGGPYHASGVRRHHLAPILLKLGIRGRSFHAFRHWLGSSSMRAGVPLPVLQRVLRHRDRRSTEVYIEPTVDDIDAAIDGAESRYLQSAENVLSTDEKRKALDQGDSQ